MKKTNLLCVFVAAALVAVMLALGVGAEQAPELLFEKLVRTEEPSGPRYSAVLPREIYDDDKLTEYGFIVISLDNYDKAELCESTFTIDADAPFLRGVNYGYVDGKKVDKHLDIDESYVTFSCVICNISEEYFDTGIVVRAYALYDGEAYYSDMYKSSYYVSAKKVKTDGEYDELDADGKALIDYVISQVDSIQGGEEDRKPVEIPSEADGIYRFVSYSEIALDEDGNWRHFYELYNPYMGEKEYDVPGIEASESAKALGDAVEAGTLIKFDGKYVDGSTAEEYSLSWCGTSGQYDTQTIVPHTDEITCPDCLAYYFDENENTSIIINDTTPVSVLSYSNFDDAFKWGEIRQSSSGEMLDFDKSVQCYNDKALDKTGENYVRKYFKFPKFIYKLKGEYEDGAECDFILIIANGDEECALGEMCEMHENIRAVQSYRIVSNYDIALDDDSLWRNFYELYDPISGEKVYDVAGNAANQKANLLPEALEAGTIISLKDGFVDETDPEAVIGHISEENLVWIKQADENGIMTVVPYEKSVACKTCAEDYISEYDGGIYRDIFGVEHTSGEVKCVNDTAFSCLTSSTYNSSFCKWASMSTADYSNIADAEKEFLCYNDSSEESNGNHKTTYADYVKAFVCTDSEDRAYFVIVIVNGDEGAAYNVECSLHKVPELSAEIFGQSNEADAETTGPVPAGVSLSADEL